MNRVQLIEVINETGRVGAVITSAGVLTSARANGADAGESVRSGAVAKAVAKTLKRAAGLLTIINTAKGKERECERRAGEVERARRLAAASTFGAVLDTRLHELDAEERAIVEERVRVQLAREGATAELQKLQSEAVGEPVSAVSSATAGRLRVAEAERARAADILAAAVAQHISTVLKLDGELSALREVNPRREVEHALAEQLPAVFGPGGIASLVAEQDEDERDEVPVKPRRGWRRPGHEETYGEDPDAWDGTSHDAAPGRLPPDQIERY